MCGQTGPGSEEHVSEVAEIRRQVQDEPEDQIVSLKLFETRPETHTHTGGSEFLFITETFTLQ